MRQTKIATCCYCGHRAALVLAGESSHELACSSCGAPIHNLKMLPKSRDKSHKDLVKPSPLPGRQDHRTAPSTKSLKPKKQKKKKSFKRRLMGEIFDIIEDIID
ncbi:MAG: hypothetical protein AAF714_02585 [Pseudomonadota bacterium]